MHFTPKDDGLLNITVRKWIREFPAMPRQMEAMGQPESFYKHFKWVFRSLLDAWSRAKSSSPKTIEQHEDFVSRTSRLIDIELVHEMRATFKQAACKPGCSFCCKSEAIGVNQLEVVSILRYISRLPEEQREVLRESIKNSTRTARVSGSVRGDPCAMLVNNKCSIYPVRPMACRGWLSASSEQCEDRLAGKTPTIDAFFSPRFVELGATTIIEANASIASYEINSILKTIYSDSTLLDAWKSGNMVLDQTQFGVYLNHAMRPITSTHTHSSTPPKATGGLPTP